MYSPLLRTNHKVRSHVKRKVGLSFCSFPANTYCFLEHFLLFYNIQEGREGGSKNLFDGPPFIYLSFFFFLDFTWKRAVVRSISVVAIIIFSTVVPNFGPVLSLAGGTLFTLLNVIFPIMFFHKLTGVISLPKTLFLVVVMLLSVVVSLGNGFVELKNVIKVVKGSYE